MKDDFLLRQIIVYALGVICICAWAIFRLIPYSIAMYFATAIFSYSMFMEAKHDKENGLKKRAGKKSVFAVILAICLVAIIILNP